jgi:hypothetical protein
MEALRGIGFEEDRGASAIMACQGMFKYQHDTDKDLKFIHVFPKARRPAPHPNSRSPSERLPQGAPPARNHSRCSRPQIDTAAAEAEAAAAAAANADEDDPVVMVAGMRLEELPPAHLCAIVRFETFKMLVARQCPTFSQRKALLKAVKEMIAMLAGFEERMTNMQPLTPQEDELYNSAQSLPEKAAELEAQLEGMMSGGYRPAPSSRPPARSLCCHLTSILHPRGVTLLEDPPPPPPCSRTVFIQQSVPPSPPCFQKCLHPTQYLISYIAGTSRARSSTGWRRTSPTSRASSRRPSRSRLQRARRPPSSRRRSNSCRPRRAPAARRPLDQPSFDQPPAFDPRAHAGPARAADRGAEGGDARGAPAQGGPGDPDAAQAAARPGGDRGQQVARLARRCKPLARALSLLFAFCSLLCGRTRRGPQRAGARRACVLSKRHGAGREDMKKLNAKPTILARLAELEAATKGWFDDVIPEADRSPPPFTERLSTPWG